MSNKLNMIRLADEAYDLLGGRLIPDLKKETLGRELKGRISIHTLRVLSREKFFRIIPSLNFSRLRMHNLFVFVSVKDKTHFSEIYNTLKWTPFAAAIYWVAGADTDLVFLFRTNKYQHLHKVVYPYLERFRESITIKKVLLGHRPIYDQLFPYPVEPLPPVKLDLLDWKIISAIEKDALTPLDQVSKKAGASEKTVSRRIKGMLESGAINGFFAVRKWSKYPAERWPVHGLVCVRGEYKHIDPVRDKLYNSPVFKNMFYSVYGIYDYVMSFRARGIPEIRKMFREVMEMPGVYSLDYYPVMEVKYPPFTRSIIEYW